MTKKQKQQIKRQKRQRNWEFYGTPEPSYNERKFDCKELNPEWRFTTYYHFVWRGNEPRCIYGIADPRDHLIRYVGQTKLSLASRLRMHRRKPVSTIMKTWLESLASAGVEPEIVAMQWCEDWHFHERKWIARLRAVGSLLNGSDGGIRGRFRSTANRNRCIGGPVKTFTAEQIAEMNGNPLHGA